MKGRDIFKIWAPTGAKWVDWVRPVPFVGIDDNFKTYQLNDFIITDITYINKLIPNTAVIIDLPGNASIKEGIAVSKKGYRPIPIFNGTDEQKGSKATVDNKIVKLGLIKGAIELERINIRNDAPPAFLLNTDRMNRFKMDVSIFDNSWDIYAQDLPSAEYFLRNGIDKIIIRSEIIQKDLNKILYKFQKKGIKILFTDGYEEPKNVKLKKPHTKSIDEI